jgi:preprotein translocase subunit SecE
MAKTSPAEFFRQVRYEVSKVTWPSRRETTQMTGFVFLLGLAAALFFFTADWILASGMRWILSLGA